MAGNTKKFKRAEIAKMVNNEKTLIIIENKVYDVTSFLNDHPGGEEILRDHAGIDASEDFQDIGHSDDALDLMKKYLVGELEQSEWTVINPKPKIPMRKPTLTESKDKPAFSLTFIAVTLFAIGIAVFLYSTGL